MEALYVLQGISNILIHINNKSFEYLPAFPKLREYPGCVKENKMKNNVWIIMRLINQTNSVYLFDLKSRKIV